jgi:hypothetical protein
VDPRLDGLLGVLLFQVAAHPIDLLGRNSTHVVLDVSHPNRLEQGNDHLVLQAKILGDLVNTRLATHTTSIERSISENEGTASRICTALLMSLATKLAALALHPKVRCNCPAQAD